MATVLILTIQKSCGKYFGQIFDVRLADSGWVGKQRGRCPNLKTKLRPHAQCVEKELNSRHTRRTKVFCRSTT